MFSCATWLEHNIFGDFLFAVLTSLNFPRLGTLFPCSLFPLTFFLPDFYSCDHFFFRTFILVIIFSSGLLFLRSFFLPDFYSCDNFFFRTFILAIIFPETLLAAPQIYFRRKVLRNQNTSVYFLRLFSGFFPRVFYARILCPGLFPHNFFLLICKVHVRKMKRTYFSVDLRRS